MLVTIDTPGPLSSRSLLRLIRAESGPARICDYDTSLEIYYGFVLLMQVTMRILDYCNSLLYNTANKDIARLQRVQNCLARVVTRYPRFSSSVPLLKSLHWLPVHYRIIFNICTISYQALASKQPTYLNSMLTPARNSRELRSTSSNPLYIPRVKMKAGTRVFSVAAPTLWNSLPVSVKSEGNIVSFRRRLKTYLFYAAYPP